GPPQPNTRCICRELEIQISRSIHQLATFTADKNNVPVVGVRDLLSVRTDADLCCLSASDRPLLNMYLRGGPPSPGQASFEPRPLKALYTATLASKGRLMRVTGQLGIHRYGLPLPKRLRAIITASRSNARLTDHLCQSWGRNSRGKPTPSPLPALFCFSQFVSFCFGDTHL